MQLTLISARTAVLIIACARLLLADRPASNGTQTVALINNALADAKPQAADEQWATLQAAMQAHPNNLLISTTLQKALDQSHNNVTKPAKSLQTALSESAAIPILYQARTRSSS